MHTIIPTTESAQPTKARTSRVVLIAALALVAATTIGLQAPLYAQSSSASSASGHASLAQPLNLTVPTLATDSSSSSSVSTDALTEARENFLTTDLTQPPPRRSYGRPRYSDKSHNPDGSNKYTFEFGAGFTLPTGGTHNYLTPSYKFQVGGGRNFSKSLAVLAQFDWDNFGIQTHTLNTLLPIYAGLCGSGCTGSAISQIGGSTHDWSFSLNPMISFAQSEKTGAYFIGGVGFYHKNTVFTTPTTGIYCDPFYGCFQYPANAPIDEYNSNAIGVNGGLGFTYRPSRFAGEKFFAEARYVYTANSRRPFSTGSSTSSYFNVFPQNSAPTTYIPITFGIRF